MKESKLARGRVGVYVPDHPAANGQGYVLRYRYVVEQSLGRFLRSDEEVHHINGDPLDDRIENLAVMAKSEHARIHANLGGVNGGRSRVHDWDKIKSLYLSGLGKRRIAGEIGCSEGSVKYAVRKMGLKKEDRVVKSWARKGIDV